MPSRKKSATPDIEVKLPPAPISRPLLSAIFGIDPRSLALFRMCLGTLILVDLCIRATDLQSMYTDDGMFSRAVICRHLTSLWNWSFHFGSGAVGYQAFLFVLAAVLAVALVIGYETRLATVGSWLMLLSLHNRVPPILSGGDNLLSLLLFWSMFLPLGRVWSMDRRRQRNCGLLEPDLTPVLSMASAGVLLQMGMMYFFSAVSKSNADWWTGRAVAGALAHDMYAKPLGEWLLQFPRALRFATYGVLATEWLAPVLLFLPNRSTFRFVALGCLAALHLGIALGLEVGLFSFVCVLGLMPFLPSAFWELAWFRRWQPAPGTAPNPALPRAVSAACAVALSYMVLVNLNGIPSQPLGWLKLDQWPVWTGLGFSQRWGMFEEVPSKDGWYVADGWLADGARVDLLRGGAPVSWSRPRRPLDAYPNHRWQKCFREIAYSDALGYQVFRQPVAEYLLRHWNERHPDRPLASLDLVFCTDTTDREMLAHVVPQ